MKRTYLGRRIAVFILITCALPAAAGGRKEQYPDPADTSGMRIQAPIPVDPRVTIGKLSNGLTYYIRENDQPEDRALLRLVVDAGSILETESQRGLAHFVEHMAFNGTENFAEHQIIDYLESIGMEFGPDINAYTGFDETVYKLQIPTDDPGVVEKGFQVLAEWAGRVSFEPEEVEAERGVIIEEWRLGRGAEARMREEYLPVLLKGSRYAERLPIGDREIIENFRRETLIDYYETWYRPDLMAVIAVGDFDGERILELVEENFSYLEMPADPKPRKEYPVPLHEETLYTTAVDPEATSTLAELFYKRIPRKVEVVEDYREMIKRRLFDMMLNARLDEVAREGDPPFLYALSSSADFVRTLSIYELACIVEEDGVERGFEALLAEAVRLRRHGFISPEIERAKDQYLAAMKRAYEERSETESVSFAGEYTRNFLNGEVIPGIEYEYELARRYSPGITLDELNRMVDDIITGKNRVVLVKGPEKKGVTYPSKERLEGIMTAVEDSELEAYTEDDSGAELFSKDVVPGTIVETVEHESVGVTELVLSNGVRVLLKPTDFKNEEILVTGFSPGGTSLVGDDEYVSASLAAMVAGASGVGDFSAVELQRKLAGRQVSVSPYIGTLTEGFSGGCVPEDLEILLQLIHLYGTEPRRDREAFDSLKARLKGMLQNRRSQPEALFQDRLQILASQGHFRERPFTPELLEELDFETAHRVYAERFADFSEAVFIFAGNFSLLEMRTLSERYLATLPAIGRDESWADPGVEFPSRNVTEVVRAGIEEKGRVALVYGGDFSWSVEREHVFDSLLTLLDIRLREVIREEASGTYGVRVGGGVGPYPEEEFRLTISFGCDPVRAEELTERVFRELDDIRENLPSELNMTKIKEMDRRSYEEALERNRFWLGSLEEADFYDLPYTVIRRFPDLVASLEGREIREMAREVLAGPYVRLTLKSELE